MAWILEKFWSWVDHDGDPLDVIDLDRLLDNVMVYWLTNSAGSSARLYWESFKDLDLREVHVPSGISSFPGEIFRTSRRWAEKRFTDLRHFGILDSGGHSRPSSNPGCSSRSSARRSPRCADPPSSVHRPQPHPRSVSRAWRSAPTHAQNGKGGRGCGTGSALSRHAGDGTRTRSERVTGIEPA
ncbi:MAG: hypothetical protein M5U19_23200 [Microthrixaceae bacterium]|nr:hypothetical protein [Microthrixaceae bacterium]